VANRVKNSKFNFFAAYDFGQKSQTMDACDSPTALSYDVGVFTVDLRMLLEFVDIQHT